MVFSTDYIVKIVYLKKHCETSNRENKIRRVKITSDPDPLSSETDQRIRIRIKIKRIRNTDLPCGTQVPVISSLP